MRRAGIILTIVFALLALTIGFAGATAALDITQPQTPGSTKVVNFEVKKGDTATSVAQRLQDEGIVRSALAFRLLARYRHLDTGIEPGVYQVSPGMKMDAIIVKLQTGKPDFVVANVPDGLRVTQYPTYFSELQNFDAQKFLQIAQTGKLADGTTLWSKYWYLPSPGKDVKWALEGYLYPAAYQFNKDDNQEVAVMKMLDTLGEKLCPGPASRPDAYIHDKDQCKAHAATLSDGKTSVFAAMEKSYGSDDTQAVYKTLILASLTAREINHYDDAPGVAAVYYNRYLYTVDKSKPDGGTAGFMGSDPSAQYARDTDNPPQNGKWWQDLGDLGKNIDPNSPYNTESHPGLPPGPIAAPLWQEILAAAAPPSSPYFYFVSDKCGKIYYAKSDAEFQQVQQKQYTGNCPG